MLKKPSNKTVNTNKSELNSGSLERDCILCKAPINLEHYIKVHITEEGEPISLCSKCASKVHTAFIQHTHLTTKSFTKIISKLLSHTNLPSKTNEFYCNTFNKYLNAIDDINNNVTIDEAIIQLVRLSALSNMLVLEVLLRVDNIEVIKMTDATYLLLINGKIKNFSLFHTLNVTLSILKPCFKSKSLVSIIEQLTVIYNKCIENITLKLDTMVNPPLVDKYVKIEKGSNFKSSNITLLGKDDLNLRTVEKIDNLVITYLNNCLSKTTCNKFELEQLSLDIKNLKLCVKNISNEHKEGTYLNIFSNTLNVIEDTIKCINTDFYKYEPMQLQTEQTNLFVQYNVCIVYFNAIMLRVLSHIHAICDFNVDSTTTLVTVTHNNPNSEGLSSSTYPKDDEHMIESIVKLSNIKSSKDTVAITNIFNILNRITKVIKRTYNLENK